MATVKLSGGERYAPADSKQEQGLPAEWRSHPYVFVHYPTGWVWDDELGDFLPSLSRIMQTNGVNGIGDDGKMNRALGGSMEKGGTIIDPRNARLGEWTNYLVRYPVVGGGYHYAFVGTEFEVLPGGRASVIEAGESYRRFLAHLVEANIVDPIPSMVVNRLIEVERTGLERLIRVAQSNPHRAPEVEAKRARIARMEAWRNPAAATSTEDEPAKAKGPRRTKLAPPETAPAPDLVTG